MSAMSTTVRGELIFVGNHNPQESYELIISNFYDNEDGVKLYPAYVSTVKKQTL